MVQTSFSAQELRALTEASISLTSELSLQTLLQTIVDVAREHIGAKYGALSVLDEDGRIIQFITSGITDEERARIGEPPQGEGLLAVLMHDGGSLRLEDLGADPRSAGFPPNHPPMKSLLGVPVIVAGRLIGNLYLTDKEGGTQFTDRDEEVVRLLSSQAAVAIHNSQLYTLQKERGDEWKALFELSRQVSGSPALQTILDSVVASARSVLGADAAAVLLLTPDREHLQMAAGVGIGEGPQEPRPLRENDLEEHVLALGRPVVIDDIESDPEMQGKNAYFLRDDEMVSAVSVPLLGKEGALGTLVAGARRKGAFSGRDPEVMEAFANWTAVAIETRHLYERLESLARLEERERIAMDLHDGVIQSIYAATLHLEDVHGSLSGAHESLQPVVERTIDDLAQVIKDIRSYIFDLRPQVSEVTDLPHAIGQLADNVRVNALIPVTLEVSDPLTGISTPEQALGLFHVAQEALNNISKHARATEVTIRLVSSATEVRLEIIDNGRGFDIDGEASTAKQGLRNMRDRARSLGALFRVDSKLGGGTKITVELPVRS